MPTWLQRISPFEHFALVPTEPIRWGPYSGVLLVAAAVSGLGIWAFRRRDVR